MKGGKYNKRKETVEANVNMIFPDNILLEAVKPLVS